MVGEILRLRKKVASDLSSGSLHPFLLGPAPRAVFARFSRLVLCFGEGLSTEVCEGNSAGDATEGTARHFLF